MNTSGTKHFLFLLPLILITALVSYVPESLADDWPQYRGPNRDGKSLETGILKHWPADGPEMLWRIRAGDGYSGMAVVGNGLFTMWSDPAGGSYLVRVNTENGKVVWKYRVDRGFSNDQGGGPRACPTVDNGLVYAVSARGSLHAVDVETGAKVWGRDLDKEYDSRIPRWGYSSSPLVEGDLLLVENGGRAGYAYLAFDKRTGDLKWHSGTDRPGYSSPLAITVAGQRQVVFFSAAGLSAVAPQNGDLLWRYTWSTSYDANIAVPIFSAPDKIFISTNYGKGAAVVQIKGNGPTFTPKAIWRNRVMRNHFNTSIFLDDSIYGFDGSILKCIDAKTGEERWKARGFQKGSLVYVDGHLIILGERGKLALAKADPNRLQIISETQPLSGKCWTMPTVANGRLFLRNQKEMVGLDIKTGK